MNWAFLAGLGAGALLVALLMLGVLAWKDSK
jgi:hypothetical protein